MAHNWFKFIIYTCLLISIVNAQFRGVYTITSVDENAITNTVKDHEEVSECSCDLKSNTWDISCCCDSDCPAQTLSLWLSDANSFCNSQIYEELKPFTECMNKDYLAFTNKRMGITIDDNDSKDEVCVSLDDRDSSSTFFEEINFANADEANTILDRWFEWEDTTDDEEIYLSETNSVYTYGNAVERYDATREIRLEMSLPQLGMFGNWDFTSSAVFGVPNDVTCLYKITDLAECTTILNPNTYSSFIVSQYRNGVSVITPTIATGSADPATTTGADWANHLTNLEITFKFSQQGGVGFSIDEVEIAYSTDSSTLAVGDIVELNVITKYQATGTDVEEKSGNPGYLANKRLLLGELNSGSIELSGYRKEISDASGEWLATNPTLSTVTDNFVRFKEEVNLQCNKAIADAAALQAECTNTAYQGYYMFNQFSKFGRYGDARISNLDDWYDIIPVTISTDPIYDSATTTCNNMITGIQYEVLISEIGYENELQSYIVAINSKPLQENVVYSTALTNLAYKAVVTNYLVLPSDIRDDEKIPIDFPPKLSNDIGSQAESGQS